VFGFQKGEADDLCKPSRKGSVQEGGKRGEKLDFPAKVLEGIRRCRSYERNALRVDAVGKRLKKGGEVGNEEGEHQGPRSTRESG